MRVADGLLAVIGKIREHAVVENLSAFQVAIQQRKFTADPFD